TRGPLAVGLPRECLRLRAPEQPGAPARARAVRIDLHRPTDRAGPRVPRIDRPGFPPGQPRERPGWGTLRGGYVPRAGGAPAVRARAGPGDRRLPSLARPRADLAHSPEVRARDRRPTAEPAYGRRANARRAAGKPQRLVAHDGAAAPG